MLRQNAIFEDYTISSKQSQKLENNFFICWHHQNKLIMVIERTFKVNWRTIQQVKNKTIINETK